MNPKRSEVQEKECNKIQELTKRLYQNHTLLDEELIEILQCEQEDALEFLYQYARRVREKYYGKKVYTRGLIEFTNYCRNNCYYYIGRASCRERV